MIKIKEFIENNKLDFTGSGSELNSNCCILAGYALYEGYTCGQLEDELIEEFPGLDTTEIVRVFDYASKKNYGEKWTKGWYEGKFIY